MIYNIKKVSIICITILLTNLASHGYSNSKRTNLDFSPKNSKVEWGSYTGYLLGNDGCYHHGTFLWEGSPSNYLFFGDNGCNNSDACSTGFADFCMDDNDFQLLC